MSEPSEPAVAPTIEETLAGLEKRLYRIERALGLAEAPRRQVATEDEPAPGNRSLPAAGGLEVAVGQNLFANIGIVVLAIGGALALSLPWQGLPAVLPSVAGWSLALVLLVVARWLQRTVPQIGKLCRGAGMALLFFAALRLCYFGEPPLFSPQSPAAEAALALVVAVNLAIGWWRRNGWLTGLALMTGYAAALAVGTPVWLFSLTTLLLVVAALGLGLRDWPWLLVAATPAGYLTYFLWALNNPLIGRRLEVVSCPLGVVFVLLGWMVIHAVGMTLRRNHATEEGPDAQLASVLNCGGYALFFGHTLLKHGESFAAANIAAAAVLLGLAVMFWVRENSRFATFVYAMTGYAALNMALIRATEVPELFVWLAGQSLLVIATAIWFRSRFIIVANFLIFLAVVTAYMILVKQESGISLIFGVVALTSSRLLKVHKDRLELQTEMMRNAYLTTAFIVLPYALYHLVPHAWVAVSWIGIALFYYMMNSLTKARKYRWMGHNTLLLTVIYILVMSIGRLQGTQRIVSFLVLGLVLLAVSLVFTLIRARQAKSGAAPAAERDNGP